MLRILIVFHIVIQNSLTSQGLTMTSRNPLKLPLNLMVFSFNCRSLSSNVLVVKQMLCTRTRQS